MMGLDTHEYVRTACRYILVLSLLCAGLLIETDRQKCNADEFVDEPRAVLKADRAMRFQGKTVKDAKAWQKACRERLFAVMMGGKKPAELPLDAQILEKRPVGEGASYQVLKVSIQTQPDRRSTALVVLPDSPNGKFAETGPKGKLGVVLALAGHGGTSEHMMQVEGIPPSWEKSVYWYGRTLAEMGYAVVIPDVGDHDVGGLAADGQIPASTEWTMMGKWVWDSLCWLDYATKLPNVDPEKIAVCGVSLGGELSMYVAALDERVKLVDSSCFLTTMAQIRWWHCGCALYPGLFDNFEYADIYSCIAPRELICELGEAEEGGSTFPVEPGKVAWKPIQDMYKVFGAADRCNLVIHPGGHKFDGKLFFKRLIQRGWSNGY